MSTRCQICRSVDRWNGRFCLSLNSDRTAQYKHNGNTMRSLCVSSVFTMMWMTQIALVRIVSKNKQTTGRSLVSMATTNREKGTSNGCFSRKGLLHTSPAKKEAMLVWTKATVRFRPWRVTKALVLWPDETWALVFVSPVADVFPSISLLHVRSYRTTKDIALMTHVSKKRKKDKTTCGKVHSGITDKNTVFQIFKGHVDFTLTTKAQNLSYRLKVNEFAGLTICEFVSRYTGF